MTTLHLSVFQAVDGTDHRGPHRQQAQGSGLKPRQIEVSVAGVPGLFIATYPSGRQTYIYRFRDPRTRRKTSLTLGKVG